MIKMSLNPALIHPKVAAIGSSARRGTVGNSDHEVFLATDLILGVKVMKDAHNG